MVSANFLYPNYLWFLLLVPFFVFIYFFGLSYNKKKAFVFSNFQAIERFYGIEFFAKNYLAMYLNICIVILMVLSLAGMGIDFTASTSAYSYVILIDTSGSMSATDIDPSRFEVAKETAKAFVDSLPLGVSVGVVGFSGDALVYQELVADKGKIKAGIENIEYGKVEGTNIYNAIITADKEFDKFVNDKMRSVILISDGQINVGEAPQILSFADRNELIINTIGVGSEEGGVSKYNTISKADVDFLKSIAFDSGGSFFRVETTDDFSESFDLLIERVLDKITIDISVYLLIAAVLLFVLNWVFHNLRLKVFP
jgi:Ca-activated chloride channel homolog